jgi:two-component system chemotaxis response regulator CheB
MTSHSTAAAAARVTAVVCDDSGLMRRLLADALGGAGVQVVGTAASGAEALELCRRLRPDVMTLDMQMPGLSGMDVLRQLPPGGPGVIVVSAYTDQGSALAVEALSIGAAEVIRKPALGTSMTTFRAELGGAVQAAAAARRMRPIRATPPVRRGVPAAPPAPGRRSSRPLVVIATSTGGPRALATFLPRLPSPCGAGVVIVQHMPPGFTAPLAQRLNAACALTVREAVDGDRVAPSVALFAPGGWHLRLDGERVRLTQEPPIGGLRPRADVTIEDAARDWQDRVVLVVLTGMGNDGLRGARALKAAGGTVLSEAEETCVVYGMPRSVEEAGLSDVVQPLAALPTALQGVMR